jgi:aminoglycoside phosphotransferase (APT) family kinase protein
MWRLGTDLAVRLPRTPRAPGLLRTEQRWLPLLAPDLPLPVPVPVRAGEPSERFPRTWTVTRWVAGEPADRAPVTSPRAAAALAGFLRALHRTAPAGAPVSPDRGGPLQALAPGFGEWLAVIAGRDATAGLRRVWAEAVAAPAWPGAPVWLHADLHPANVIVSGGTAVRRDRLRRHVHGRSSGRSCGGLGPAARRGGAAVLRRLRGRG